MYKESFSMKHLAFLIAFAIVVGGFSTEQLRAQDQSQNPQVISLHDAVTLALNRNYQVNRSKATVEAEDARVRSAYGNFMPNLNLSAGASQREQIGPLVIEGQRITATRSSTTLNTRATSSVTIFDGFSNFSDLNQARYNRASANHSLRNTERSVVTQVYNLYFEVFRREELLKVSEENLKRSQAQLERIKESNRVGAVPIVDVYRQQVVVGNDELALIQAEQNLENAKSDLVYYIGLNPILNYEFDPAGVPTSLTEEEIEATMERFRDFDELQRKTVATRPDIEAAQQRVYATESNVTSARGNYWPTVSLGANYNITGETVSTIDESRTWSYGLDISIPIFQRFQRNNQVQQARVQVKRAEIEHEELRNQALLDVRQAYLALETARKQVQVTEQNIISSREEQRLAEERYNLGAGTLLDLIIANANLAETEANNVNAIFSFQLAIRELEYLTGEELY